MSESGKSGIRTTSSGNPKPIAEAVIKGLRCEATALRESGERARPHDRPNLQPLMTAGAEIMRAACEGLLDGIIDLAKIAPEARRLMLDYCQQRPRPSGQQAKILAAGPVELLADASVKPEASETMFWAPLTESEVDAIRDNPTTVELRGDGLGALSQLPPRKRNSFGFTGTNPLHDPGFICMSITTRCWRYLSRNHHDEMPQEVAFSFLTNPRRPEIWSGSKDDFSKMAWVCEFLADQIEKWWNAMTLADLAKEFGLDRSVVLRACRPTQKREPHIESNGKQGKELRISRKSFLAWHANYQDRKGRREQSKQLRVVYSYQCTNSDCDWISPATLEAPPKKCPKCSKPIRPIERAAHGRSGPSRR